MVGTLFATRILCMSSLGRRTGRLLHLVDLCRNFSSSCDSVGQWQSVIGLEIHAQIQSDSKLFSAAGTRYAASTNSQVAYFDAALPGTLPVINRRCVEAGVMTALSLGCRINPLSLFDRKHYFYADMPAGYQITQQRQPLAVGGRVPYVFRCTRTNRVEERTARLVQVQLEQDSGKSLHDPENRLSLIDLNRAGVGLMEIVTSPDFTHADDAASFVKDLRDILLALGTCDGKMQEGSLRVDANISVNRPGEGLGTRTEVKNLNSTRGIRHAINYEIQRQIKVLSEGGKVVNETMTYDPETEQTVPMRDKEKILDYRFMPEPNLPPLVVYDSRENLPKTVHPDQLSNVVVIEEVRGRMSALPNEKRKHLMSNFGLSLLQAMTIVRAGLADLFEDLVTLHGCEAQVASNFVRSIYKPFLENNSLLVNQTPLDLHTLAKVVILHQTKAISTGSVSVLLQEKYKNPEISLDDIIAKFELYLINDFSTIEEIVDGIMSRNPAMVRAYKRGKLNQLEVIYKRVMKKLGNKANGSTVTKIIRSRLEQ